jgi:hypothetical protein
LTEIGRPSIAEIASVIALASAAFANSSQRRGG